MADRIPPDPGNSQGVSRKAREKSDQKGAAATAPRLREARAVARSLELRTAVNGVRYASFGEIRLAAPELERIVAAVPVSLVSALDNIGFYFVPLVLPPTRDGEDVMVASVEQPEWAENAICHRDVSLRGDLGTPHTGTFISALLLRDAFALAFEYFINVAHDYVDVAGVPDDASQLFLAQAEAGVRGECSADAFQARSEALPESIPSQNGRQPPQSTGRGEAARAEFLRAAMADSLAIYMLSLALDFDYAELREREYPLLAPAALAERLRLMARLFPPNAGYDFSVRYRRR